MSDFYSLDDYLTDLVKDAKIYVQDFYENNDSAAMPTPYANIVNFYDLRESYNVRFPASTEEVDRPTQYYMLSRFASQFLTSRLGVVAVMRIQIPARPEIDEKYWNRDSPALLIGVASNETMDKSTPYETSIVLFDHFDGKLDFFDITDMRVWEEFVDHTSIFRDFLIFGGSSECRGTFDLGVNYSMLKSRGFIFDVEPKELQSLFISQPDFIMPPGMTYADL